MCACPAERSNVGGFHSTDDLFEWPEMQDALVPDLIHDAVCHIDNYEINLRRQRAGAKQSEWAGGEDDRDDSLGCRAARLPLRKAEAWVNVSRTGHWNRLHTHPGATFSGCYYVAGGQGELGDAAGQSTLPVGAVGEAGGVDRVGRVDRVGVCGAQMMGGRLLLLTDAPDSIGEHSLPLVHPRGWSGETGGLEMEMGGEDRRRGRKGTVKAVGGQKQGESEGGEGQGEQGEGAVGGKELRSLLQIDAEAGMLVVFPSFVPHCVLPLGLTSGTPAETLQRTDP
jgi:hypothetical protein